MTTELDWSQFDTPTLLNLIDVIGNDGHSIYPARYLLNHSVPTTIVKHFCALHTSSATDFKEQITVNGLPVDQMEGAYGLTVLWSLARHLNVTSSAMGRGFQAGELTKGILEKLGAKHAS